MRLGEILNAGEIELVEQAHLIKIQSIETDKNGKPYLKALGLSPDGEGNFTTKLVLNVFPSMSMLSNLSEVVKAPGMVLVFGELSVADTDYGNEVRSIASASLGYFNSVGEYTLDGGTLKGTPGSLVYIPVASKASLKLLDTVSERNPGRKTVDLKKRHQEMRGKGMGPKPDSSTPGSPDSTTVPDPAGAVN